MAADTQKKPAFWRQPAAQSAARAFVAGYVDVVGFVGLFGLFTAHVTGNFVMIGVDLIGTSHGILAKVLSLPVFALAVAASALAVARARRQGGSAHRAMLLWQAILLALFLAAGLATPAGSSADAPLALCAGLLGVAAMGIQNAESRLLQPHLAPTTVMTGNTTQVVIDLVDYWHTNGAARKAVRDRMGRIVTAIIAFASGAMLGALAYAAASFWALALPIAILLGLAAVS